MSPANHPPAPHPAVRVEACVETLAAARHAEAVGCDRIELCVSLGEGGVTPSIGLIAACADALTIPVHVLVRPRGGAFVYTPDEVAVMRRDLLAIRDTGADGVVIGALRPDDTIDLPVVAALVEAAQPLTVGFHRAFDRVPEPLAALDDLRALGCTIVLTSGGAPTALDGAARLAALVRAAGEDVEILAGGKVTASNVQALLAATGVRAVHASAYATLPAALRPR